MVGISIVPYWNQFDKPPEVCIFFSKIDIRDWVSKYWKSSINGNLLSNWRLNQLLYLAMVTLLA